MKNEIGRNNSIISLYILVNIVMLISCSQSRSNNETQCITANNNWDFMNSHVDMIPDSSVCTSISTSCCHIKIAYVYNEMVFNNSYCFTISGLISDWEAKFTNYYNDELMWLGNYFMANQAQYSDIGNNLNYTWDNYTCMQTHNASEFSTYYLTHCGLFDSDGTCAIMNNDTYFNDFVKVLYKNTTDGLCNNVDPVTGNCITYTEYENDTALDPLLNVLKEGLKLDANTTTSQTGDLIVQQRKPQSNNTSCRPTPKVTVEIICSDQYVASSFINPMNSLLTYLLVLVALVLF